MSAHIDTMIELLKKKKPSSSDKKQFLEAWKGLVTEVGFSEEAEKYLYDGLNLCGAEPFYWYLNRTDNQSEGLQNLFNGSCYEKGSKSTFLLLTHLLALLLKGNTSSDVIALMIERFPSASSIKGGKRPKDFVKTMKRYFFDILPPAAELIPLSSINLDHALVNSFVFDLLALIGEVRKDDDINEPTTTGIERACEWIGGYLVKSEGVKPTDSHMAGMEEALNDFSVQALPYLKRIEEGQERCARELSKFDQILSHECQRNRDFENTTQNLLMKILQQLEQQRDDLNVAIAEKDAAITEKAEKEKEIEELKQLFEVLNRDKSRQVEENLQRIASQIRVEYRDFQDAKDLEMTADLGENLREQLKNIFRILEKEGMKIQ